MASSLAQPEVFEKYFAQVLRSVEQGDLDSARRHALAAATIAEAMNDVDSIFRAGDALERFNEFRIAGRLMARAGRIIAGTIKSEWDGNPMAGTLLIEQRVRHIGAPIRNARLVQLAARRVSRCVVLINPRLVSLYQRSFPNVEIYAQGRDNDALRSEADVLASFETLMQYLTPDSATLATTFSALRPDAALVRRLRARYRPTRSNSPAIGISWGSTNNAKDLPHLDCWAQLLREVPANFISLQYGDVAADLGRFHILGGTLFNDATIDSLQDLDSFAAQVASLDAVVTISNTTAHMAGALGIPTIVILDDNFHLIWPVGTTITPWYPKSVLVRKQARTWAEAFVEVRERLFGIVKSLSENPGGDGSG